MYLIILNEQKFIDNESFCFIIYRKNIKEVFLQILDPIFKLYIHEKEKKFNCKSKNKKVNSNNKSFFTGLLDISIYISIQY